MASRRQFLKYSSAAIASAAIAARSPWARAEGQRLPLGLQLYSVRDQLVNDYERTLNQLAGAGYREVEAAGFYHKTAVEVKKAMANAGLRCVSSHVGFADLHDHFDDVLAFHKTIGAEAIVCPGPGTRVPGTKTESMALEDWRWNAEQFNLIGTKLETARIRFGYHNHYREFAPVDGGVPLDELLRLTDPSKVNFELDCGWAVVGNVSPVEYFRRYPNRFTMLHVKDFVLPADKSGPKSDWKVTELGLGGIDYAPILRAAAKSEHIRHIFVEQEAFDKPWLESLKVDAEYMRHLKV